jgi:hypothetical protein
MLLSVLKLIFLFSFSALFIILISIYSQSFCVVTLLICGIIISWYFGDHCIFHGNERFCIKNLVRMELYYSSMWIYRMILLHLQLTQTLRVSGNNITSNACQHFQVWWFSLHHLSEKFKRSLLFKIKYYLI